MSDSTILKILDWFPLIATLVGSVVIILISDKIKPGAKGKLSTTRQHFFKDMQVSHVKKEMERRLAAENFELETTSDQNIIKAYRKKKRPKDSAIRNYPFEKLKLEYECRFVQSENGVQADMKIGTPQTITIDTGESEYFEVMLDYFMIRGDIRKMDPVESPGGRFAFTIGLLSLSYPLLFVLPNWSSEFAQEFLKSILSLAVVTLLMGVWDLVKVAVSDGKYKGYLLAALSLGLAALTFVFAVIMYFIAL